MYLNLFWLVIDPILIFRTHDEDLMFPTRRINLNKFCKIGLIKNGFEENEDNMFFDNKNIFPDCAYLSYDRDNNEVKKQISF